MLTRNRGKLSAEECVQLQNARAKGALCAEIYKDGVFSEQDFIVFGVLQRLTIRGFLTYEGLKIQEGSTAYHFALVQDHALSQTVADAGQRIAA